MKKDIHPAYDDAVIKCACGSVITTKATKKEIHVEVCSQSNGFYTGKQKLVDAAGRVEKFQKKYGRIKK